MKWNLLFCLLLLTGLSWMALFFAQMAIAAHDVFGMFLAVSIYIMSVRIIYKEIDYMIIWDAMLKADYADNDTEKEVKE